MAESAGVCSACGSSRIVPDLTIADHDHLGKRELGIELPERPGALVFKGTRRFPLRAQVCGDCGHVELTVITPGEIWTLFEDGKGT
jgi:hypothetical protein